ncbi:MAG TPA: amidohydrolase family protein [Polyangiaceae bacterium]|nr:amidohydrolase family protein [Polyangiaceae bacterium]
MIIDTHQHFWRYRPDRYAWIDESMAALRRDFGPGDLEPSLKASGVAGTIAVEARGHVEETDQLLAIAERTPFVRGVVGWLPLTEPDVGELIERYASQPKLRGLRHWLGASSDLSYMSGAALHRGLERLTPSGLSFDLMLWPPQLGSVASFVDRHPRQVFILDHFAKPYIRAGQIEPWRTQLRELARRPHVYCKLSGLTTEADWSAWQASDLDPYLDAALEAFSAQRLLFGSDWPVCTLATGYGRWLDTIQGWASRLSTAERERILGGTALEVYRLDPEAGPVSR